MNTKILCDKSLLDNIGDAIRSRVGTTDKMTITQLATGAGYNEDLTAELTEQAEVIASLEEAVAGKAGGGSTVLDSLTVIENGTYRPLSGIDGFNEVVVNVANSGESQPSGVCSSLTIDSGGLFTLVEIYYSSNGQYQYEFNSIEDIYTVYNVDVGRPVFITGQWYFNNPQKWVGINASVLCEEYTGTVIECTSTEPAILTI